MTEKVSIIIPVHNGEEYIHDTLNCIKAQTYENLEIIIVDDGSTDRTKELIDEAKQEDSRIQYIYQEKRNAGVARNHGLEQSTGAYLLFCDADDLFEPDMVSVMMEKICSDDAELCVCNADQYDTTTGEYLAKPQYMRKKFLPETLPFSRKEIGHAMLYFTTSVPWNKLVKRSFVEEHGLRFQDIERANDQYFSILALILAKRITVTDQVLVHYRIRQKGNLTTEFSETPLCAYQAMLAVKEELSKRHLIDEEDVRRAFDNKVLNLMIYSLNIQRTTNGYRQLYNTLKEGGFSKLGMELQDESYYFNRLEYENFCHFKELAYDEFLLLKNREYRDVIAAKNAKYKEMTEKKDAVIRNLKEKEKELNAIKKKNWYQNMTKWIARYHKLIGKEN